MKHFKSEYLIHIIVHICFIYSSAIELEFNQKGIQIKII